MLAALVAATAFAGPPAPAARPPVARTTSAGIEAARRYAAARPGRVAFAVLTRQGGPIRGLGRTQDFPSASVSKAMLLVAALLRGTPDAAGREQLEAMVTRSDNAAAQAVYARLGGDAALASVARSAGMRAFRPTGYAFGPRITAADQVRLFVRIDRLVPAGRRAYARGLLASIVPGQRWGIAPVARRRQLQIRFKGGWRTGLVHQVALLEGGGERLALAVLTDGQPSMAVGEATIEGIAARVVAR